MGNKSYLKLIFIYFIKSPHIKKKVQYSRKTYGLFAVLWCSYSEHFYKNHWDK